MQKEATQAMPNRNDSVQDLYHEFNKIITVRKTTANYAHDTSEQHEYKLDLDKASLDALQEVVHALIETILQVGQKVKRYEELLQIDENIVIGTQRALNEAIHMRNTSQKKIDLLQKVLELDRRKTARTEGLLTEAISFVTEHTAIALQFQRICDASRHSVAIRK